MKSIFNIGLLVALAITIVFIQQSSANYLPACGTNEEYNSYGGTCDTSCDNLHSGASANPSYEQCPAGCFCKQGYYRAANKKCVKPDKCCDSKTEVYNSYGGQCDASCSNFQYGASANSYYGDCPAGCFCKEGLYRGADGKCVKAEKCCDSKTEVYNSYGGQCDATCSNLQYGAPANPYYGDCPAGCFCKEGYYRGADGKCVKAEKCCDSGSEVYNSYGGQCDASCSSLQYPVSGSSSYETCQAGCFCKANYYRGADGKCVKRSKCCQGKNEVYSSKSACPKKCTTPSYPPPCYESEVPACVCKSGYVRQDDGYNIGCIKRNQCPSTYY